MGAHLEGMPAMPGDTCNHVEIVIAALRPHATAEYVVNELAGIVREVVNEATGCAQPCSQRKIEGRGRNVFAEPEHQLAAIAQRIGVPLCRRLGFRAGLETADRTLVGSVDSSSPNLSPYPPANLKAVVSRQWLVSSVSS